MLGCTAKPNEGSSPGAYQACNLNHNPGNLKHQCILYGDLRGSDSLKVW